MCAHVCACMCVSRRRILIDRHRLRRIKNFFVAIYSFAFNYTHFANANLFLLKLIHFTQNVQKLWSK